MNPGHTIGWAVALSLTAVTCAPGAEAVFPAKPVRVLVGFSPGGGTDVAMRIIGRKLAEAWNQQVVVDNRPGAGGLIAFDIVAKANPDGYTLLATSPAFAIQPGLSAKLPYDPIRDFAPVTMASAAPYIALGLEPVGNSAAEFTKTVRDEIRQWGEVIRRAGIKAE